MTGLSRGARVLEAGSGPGYASSLFAAHHAVGLSVAADGDIDAMREARRRDPSLPVVVADLRRLPFREGAFDLVWNSSTLEHVDRPEVALAEMQRVTRADGHVFVGVPHRYGALGFQPVIAGTRWGVWIGPVFDRRRLAALMVSSALVPIAHSTYFYGIFLGMLARKPATATGGTGA
jgi:SAM-dependent methyltransferase